MHCMAYQFGGGVGNETYWGACDGCQVIEGEVRAASSTVMCCRQLLLLGQMRRQIAGGGLELCDTWGYMVTEGGD